MNQLQHRTLAPITALRLVPELRECPMCEGAGEYLAGGMTGNDPSNRVHQCTTCMGGGEVPNDDFDPAMPFWYCACPTNPSPLTHGDDCRLCGAAVADMAVAA